jgi:hypothetical protein
MIVTLAITHFRKKTTMNFRPDRSITTKMLPRNHLKSDNDSPNSRKWSRKTIYGQFHSTYLECLGANINGWQSFTTDGWRQGRGHRLLAAGN